MNFNLNSIIKKAQKMEEKMSKMRQEIAERKYEGMAGGGMVKSTFTGDFKMVKIEIDDSIVNVAEKEVLGDLIAASVNNAIKKINEDISDSMAGSLPAGLDPKLSGMF